MATVFSIGNLVGVFFLDGYEFSPITGLVLGVYGLIAFCLYKEKQYEYRQSIGYVAPKKEPGFLTLAYRKFKDKTCIKINFE